MLTAVAPAPSPSPSYLGPDPFGPLDVSKFPPPPPWVIPTFMALMVLALLITVWLLFMWHRRTRADRAIARERYRAQTWIDLNDFDPKKDGRRPRSPKILRDELDEDDER